ncbi:MAG: DUF2027 domain-containing protein [Bacteroidales bacterium]|jgi:hypothetical protein|nr:DUF2027 domain-containing protein [Bacteroidales bacterium]
MKLQVGDTVRYLNDVGGGVVRRILSNTMVEITDESGFEIPVYEHELVMVHAAQTAQTPEKPKQEIAKQQIEQAIEIENNDTPQFYIAFTKNLRTAHLFDLYIINDCNYSVAYSLLFARGGTWQLCETGMLESNTKLFLQSISLEELSNIEKLSFQALLFKSKKFELQPPFVATMVFSPVKFHKPGVFTVNDFFEEDAYVIELVPKKQNTESSVIDALETVSAIDLQKKLHDDLQKNTAFKVTKQEKNSTKEVDLHLHELVENEQGLQPEDMIAIQMQTFEKELAAAIAQAYEKIVFIHGVGSGVLKARIRITLDRDYPHLFYQDASFQKYKFGATLVYLKGRKK